VIAKTRLRSATRQSRGSDREQILGSLACWGHPATGSEAPPCCRAPKIAAAAPARGAARTTRANGSCERAPTRPDCWMRLPRRASRHAPFRPLRGQVLRTAGKRRPAATVLNPGTTVRLRAVQEPSPPRSAPRPADTHVRCAHTHGPDEQRIKRSAQAVAQRTQRSAARFSAASAAAERVR